MMMINHYHSPTSVNQKHAQSELHISSDIYTQLMCSLNVIFTILSYLSPIFYQLGPNIADITSSRRCFFIAEELGDSGVHRPPEGQGQNGVMRAQSWTGGGGWLGIWVWSPSARGGRYGKNIMFFFLYYDSRFFVYFASCLSITAKLISLL